MLATNKDKILLSIALSSDLPGVISVAWRLDENVFCLQIKVTGNFLDLLLDRLPEELVWF